MAKPENLTDSYEFELVGADNTPFKGYVSSVDPTNITPQVAVRGSKNVYKKNTGNFANRPGLKRRGTADGALAPVKSSYEWYTSLGNTIPLRVANGNLQFESDIADGATLVWYTLLAGITFTRYVFDTWWSQPAAKDILMMVRGDNTLETWSGGIALVASATAPVAGTIQTATLNAAGNLYKIGDTLTPITGNADAVFTVTATDVNGHVTGIQLKNPGTGYSNQTNIATTTNSLQGTGATIDITAVQSAGTITISGTKFWAQMGFDSSGSIIINGNTYSYSGGTDGLTLYGVTTDPSGEPAGSVAFQTINTNTNFPFTGFTADFIKVIGNRLHVGSYTSREIPISDSASYTNFTVPSPRVAGSAELLILDNTAKGITVSKGNAFITAGLKDWYEISYSALTVGTTATEVTSVDKKPTAELSAALAHEFIDTVGDDIIYLDQQNQLRQLGTFRNLNQPKYPSLSIEIEDELRNETFVDGMTAGHVRAVGDFIYMTSPISGRTYLRQTRETVDEVGNVVAERFWHPPQVWSAARMAVIGGTTFVHSNANPQIYQVWDTMQWHDDSPSDEPLSYTSVLLTGYRSMGRRQGMWWLNKLYVEGYMTQGTQLDALIYYDYQGSRGLLNLNINSVKSPAKFFSGNDAPSLGDDSLGDNPLGDGLNELEQDQQDLPKFRAIPIVNPVNVFEFAIAIYSQNVDDRWEIECFGTNVSFNGEQQAGFITK